MSFPRSLYHRPRDMRVYTWRRKRLMIAAAGRVDSNVPYHRISFRQICVDLYGWLTEFLVALGGIYLKTLFILYIYICICLHRIFSINVRNSIEQ